MDRYGDQTLTDILARHALVVGAGIGGLTAAGALANHFEQVTVLERDALAREPSHRPGTPQSRQLHGLLSGGLRAMCQIFPAFDQDLAMAGAAPLRVAGDFREELPGFDPFPRRDFGSMVYAASRPLLEHTIRRRLLEHRNVVVRDRCRVLDLLPSRNGRSVAGARCEEIGGTRETLWADLVVDASSRGALTLAALDAMGRTRPRQTTVGVNIGYATAAFAIPAQRRDWKAVLTFGGAPSDRRCGYLMPIEGNRWLACITELHCPRPPLDLTEFLDATSQLRSRTIYDAVRNSEPAGMVQRFRFPESSWRHYESIVDFPQNLIPIGDAICRFNPVYGQGMSVAAREAGILRQLLRRRARHALGLAALPQEFFAEVQPWIAGAWSMSAIPDLAHPQTIGDRPANLEHALAGVGALHRLAARDPDVHRLLVAAHQLELPSDLFDRPALASRVAAEMAAAGPSFGTSSAPGPREPSHRSGAMAC